MKFRIILAFAILSFLLAACAPKATQGPSPSAETPVITTQVVEPTVENTSTPESPNSSELVEVGELSAQTDSQGAVAVTIMPKLGQASDGSNTLVFEVSLETHSVDLSMDLAQLATLQTDTGITVQAVLWDAPRGGHHVGGTLQFPSKSNGQYVLEGAKSFKIILKNVDAAERKFTWQLDG